MSLRPVALAAIILVACARAATPAPTIPACDLSQVPTPPPSPLVVKGAPIPAAPDLDRLIADAVARSDAALAAFRASGCDPRALKQIAVSHLDGPRAATLDDAVEQADTIVVGRVASIAALDIFSPGGRLPVSIAHVDVSQTLKGTSHRTLDVKQIGGIALQPEGLVLGHLGAELVLPGDEVVLLLEQRADALWAIYPLGAVRLHGSAVDPTVTTPYEEAGAALRAMTRAELLARIRQLHP